MRKFIAATFMIICTLVVTLGTGVSALTSGAVTVPGSHPLITITARNASWSQTPARENGTYDPAPGDVFFVLAIGNDYRPGVEGARADALHLFGINVKQKRVSVINFPRDTNVAIPGHGRSKINAANAYGGSALTAQTIEQLTGVKISYVLETAFAGFTQAINDLGGIDVNVKTAMSDHYSGAYFSPGIHHMTGDQALTFSRDRHDFAQGDIQRTHNQADLLIAAVDQMKKSKTSVASKFESAAYIAKNIKLTNLTLRDLYFMMKIASTIDTSTISNITVPWAGSNTLAPRATDLFNDFKDNAIIDTYKP
jgi:LCP family protein required for cell wall assembly